MPISAMHFGRKKVEIEEDITPQKAHDYVRKPQNVWIDVINEDNEELKDILALVFPEYYNLILEDCIEDTRPKIERYKDITFIVFKTTPGSDLNYSQMSVIMGNNFLLTIRRGKTDLSKVKSFFMDNEQHNVDFVIYKIFEIVFGSYLRALDKVEDKIEAFEENAIKNPKIAGLAEIMELKKKLFQLHKILASQREIVAILFKGEVQHIKPKTRVYLRDTYDDITKLIDLAETYRDTAKGLIELHLSSTSAQVSEVMKVLTAIATFVLVPSLIASIYGMNFTHLPLKDWQYGYEFTLAIMGLLVFAIYLFFKKKQWI